MIKNPESSQNEESEFSSAPSATTGENPPAEDLSAPPPAATQNTEEVIRHLREQNRQLTDQVLRSRADLDNARKRLAREKEEFQQYNLGQTLDALLPILDGFELALAAEGGGDDYRRGVEIIYLQLLGTLQRLGLVPIDAKGKPFDPNVHEAVMTVETDEFPDQHVVDELQRGYFFKNRLLRPAKVKVAKNSAK
jgi:molecular chaperone GrpE